MPKKYYPRKPRAYKKKAVRRPRTKKNTFAKRVKSIMHSQIENKVISTYVANQTLNVASTLLSPTYFNMFPSPTIGASSSQRIGNEITVVKATLRGRVNCLPYDVASNPIISPILIRMFLCRRKDTSVGIAGAPTITNWNQFFQSGASVNGFQANVLDTLFKTNSDYWSVLSTKTIQVQPWGTIIAGSSILGGGERVSVPFYFSFAKHLGKLKYNDAGAEPTNKELFLAFQAVYSNGSTATSNIAMAEVHFDVEYEYEDA